MAGVLPLQSDFIMLDKLIRSLPELVNKVLQVGNDAAKNYDAIKREIRLPIDLRPTSLLRAEKRSHSA